MDCDSKGCRFKSYYLPMWNVYNTFKNININFEKNLIKKIKPSVYNFKNIILHTKKNLTHLHFYNPHNLVTTHDILNITNPKNQFFISYLHRDKQYVYSTGMILKTLQLQSRSIRRLKTGLNVFVAFFLKKLKTTSNLIIILKKCNKLNLLKAWLLKFSNMRRIFFLIKINKNYTKKNYKKISYINKRIRRRYFIE